MFEDCYRKIAPISLDSVGELCREMRVGKAINAASCDCICVSCGIDMRDQWQRAESDSSMLARKRDCQKTKPHMLPGLKAIAVLPLLSIHDPHEEDDQS